MRTHIIALFLLASAPAAFAQEVVAPPAEPAPEATAPIETRSDWCDQYASWFVAITPATRGAAPADVRASQRLEVEMNSCKIDPRQYERETRAEADRAVEVAQG